MKKNNVTNNSEKNLFFSLASRFPCKPYSQSLSSPPPPWLEYPSGHYLTHLIPDLTQPNSHIFSPLPHSPPFNSVHFSNLHSLWNLSLVKSSSLGSSTLVSDSVLVHSLHPSEEVATVTTVSKEHTNFKFSMDSAENLNTDAQKNAMKDILPANIVQDVTMLESANTTASTP